MNQEDKELNRGLAEKLLSEQNFTAAVIVGAAATVLAAVAYGIVTALWDFSYGFAAAAIGIVVGLSMQFLGRGIEAKFAILASAYTIAGCVLGEMFRIVMLQARSRSGSPFDIAQYGNWAELAEQAASNRSLLILVYWFVAVWFAVFLVKRPLSRAENLALKTSENSD